MNPLDFLMHGGQGGIQVSPSSSASSAPFDNRLVFGNSAPPASSQAVATGVPLFLIGAFALAGIWLWRR